MKNASFVLLTCLVLPLSAHAKGKAKPVAKGDDAPSDLQPAKSKFIDLTPREGEVPPGIISSEVNGRDLEFFLNAYEIGGLETWLGVQAKQRGEADKVKAVGDALQSTQAEENELLHKLAKRKGVALPETPPTSANQMQLQERLGKTPVGPAFDKAVMEEISTATQQVVDVYGRAVESKDADVQKFAKQVLPIVQEKLEFARRLAGKALPPGAKPGFRDATPPPPPPPLPPPVPLVPRATPPGLTPRGPTPVGTPRVITAAPGASPAPRALSPR